MKLTYHGWNRNHGEKAIHNGENFCINTNKLYVNPDYNTAVARKCMGRIEISFHGSANLSSNSEYRMTISIDEKELVALFEAQFGLDASPMSVKTKWFQSVLREHESDSHTPLAMSALSPPLRR